MGLVYPTQAMIRWDDEKSTEIEDRVGALEFEAAIDAANAAAAAAHDAADDAATAATAANTAATTAQATADNLADVSALQNSLVDLACAITSDPATKDIDITAHDRLYGDGTSAAVNAGSVSGAGLAYDTLYYIGYDDAARTGGAVTYQAFTNAADANYTAANPNRHFVGFIKTPISALDPATVGGTNSAPPQVTNEFIAGQITY